MYIVALGLGVASCEYLVDKYRAASRSPEAYVCDAALVALAMGLLKLLEYL